MTFRSLLFSAVAACALGVPAIADAQQARDQIRAVGSSTVFPFTTTVAEQFARTSGRKAPKATKTAKPAKSDRVARVTAHTAKPVRSVKKAPVRKRR